MVSLLLFRVLDVTNSVIGAQPTGKSVNRAINVMVALRGVASWQA